MKHTPERHVVIWTVRNWYRIAWVLMGLYALYSVNAFVNDFETAGDRWMQFTKYMHDKMEEHDAPLGDLPRHQPPTDD
jgi:hypothetical protein